MILSFCVTNRDLKPDKSDIFNEEGVLFFLKKKTEKGSDL